MACCDGSPGVVTQRGQRHLCRGAGFACIIEEWGSSLEGDRETLEEDPTSLAVTEVQELSLPSGVSQLSLCEEEEEEVEEEEEGTSEEVRPVLRSAWVPF